TRDGRGLVAGGPRGVWYYRRDGGGWRGGAVSPNIAVGLAAVATDGRAAAGTDPAGRTVRLIGLAAPRGRAPPVGGDALPWAVALSPDGRRLAVGVVGGTGRGRGQILVGDCAAGRWVADLPGHPTSPAGGTSFLAFLPDGRLVSSGYDTAVRVW